MSVTAPDNRISTYNPVAATTVFEAQFPVFDNDDLSVFLDGNERTDFTVSATYVEGISNDAKVTFATGLIGKVQVVGTREPHRTNRFGSGPIPTRDLNLAFDTLEAEVQEARRDITRSVKAGYGENSLTFGDIHPGNFLAVNEDNKIIGVDPPSGAGNMNTSIYDPLGFSANAFDAKNWGQFPTRASVVSKNIHASITFLRTAGYNSAGDGGAALYKAVGSEPTHLGKVQSADGKWWELVSDPTPYMFGAVGDGVANDASAIQALLNFCALKNIAVDLSAGKFSCGTTGLTAAGVPKIFGRGRQATKLIWDAGFSGVGLDITISLDGAYSQQVELASFSLETKAAATGGAIRVVGTSSGAGSVNMDRSTNRLTVRDIFITGKTFPLTDGWSTGLTIRNITNALVDGFSFRGKVNFAGEPNYDSNDAIAYQGDGITPHHVALTVVNSFIIYSKRGLNCYDFEGVLIDNCQIIGVDKGILFAAATDYPHASVFNSHINAATACIEITNIKEFVITGNCLYNELGSAAGKHVDVIGISSFGTISGNIFENLKTAIHCNSIVFRDTVHHCLITSNVWKRTNPVNGSTTSGICIWMMASTTWNKAPASVNLYDASGTYLLNQGTNNSG